MGEPKVQGAKGSTGETQSVHIGEFCIREVFQQHNPCEYGGFTLPNTNKIGSGICSLNRHHQAVRLIPFASCRSTEIPLLHSIADMSTFLFHSLQQMDGSLERKNKPHLLIVCASSKIYGLKFLAEVENLHATEDLRPTQTGAF